MSKGLWILLAYASVMLAATVAMTKKEKDVRRFCVGDRNAHWLLSALSIAATWIWAPSLFVSTEKAYTSGFVGLFWFLVPNILCLIFFVPFARRIRREMPEGITLSGFMRERYRSDGVRRAYLFHLVGLSVLSTGVQLLAGSKILAAVTGLPFWVLTVILAGIAFSYSQFSGIKASMLTDAVQMVFMLAACVLLLAFSIRSGGAWSLSRGMAGANGEISSLFSRKGAEVFMSFGLPTAIGLISGPFGDQSFWQRAFSVQEKHIGRSFFLGAVFFGIVPLSMGILGFVGAGIGYQAKDLGVINFEIIERLFPPWVMVPFLLMVISGLLSTVDSNLCAVSSLMTDVPGASIKKMKCAMVVLLAAGILIANIPGLTVTHLFLFYGTLRASTLLPTILTLRGARLAPRGITRGIAASLAVGLPIFAYGSVLGSGAYKTIGSLITVLLSGLVAMAVSWKEARHENCAR